MRIHLIAAASLLFTSDLSSVFSGECILLSPEEKKIAWHYFSFGAAFLSLLLLSFFSFSAFCKRLKYIIDQINGEVSPSLRCIVVPSSPPSMLHTEHRLQRRNEKRAGAPINYQIFKLRPSSAVSILAIVTL